MSRTWFANWGQVLQTLFAFIAAFIRFEPSKETVMTDPVSAGAIVWYSLWGILGIGILVGVVAIIGATRGKINPDRRVALTALWELVHAHARIYKEMASKFPSQTQRPLHPSSWPDWGKPWEFVHAELYSESAHLRRTIALASALWGKFGYPRDFAFFKVPDNTTMAGLQTAIEDFDYALREKCGALRIGNKKANKKAEKTP
jgi:hypothetical protein